MEFDKLTGYEKFKSEVTYLLVSNNHIPLQIKLKYEFMECDGVIDYITLREKPMPTIFSIDPRTRGFLNLQNDYHPVIGTKCYSWRIGCEDDYNVLFSRVPLSVIVILLLNHKKDSRMSKIL